jgi:hypothetical protein
MVSNMTEERANVIASAFAQIPQKVWESNYLMDTNRKSLLNSENKLSQKNLCVSKVNCCAEGMDQVLEHMPNKHKPWDQTPVLPKKNKLLNI